MALAIPGGLQDRTLRSLHLALGPETEVAPSFLEGHFQVPASDEPGEDPGRVHTDVPVCDGESATDRPSASMPRRDKSRVGYGINLWLAGNEPAYFLCEPFCSVGRVGAQPHRDASGATPQEGGLVARSSTRAPKIRIDHILHPDVAEESLPTASSTASPGSSPPPVES